jgi:hypothetical protein
VGQCWRWYGRRRWRTWRRCAQKPPATVLRDDGRLADVRELVLHRNQLGDDGVWALAGSTALTALTVSNSSTTPSDRPG